MLIPEVLEKFTIEILEDLVAIEFNGGEDDFKLTFEVYSEELDIYQVFEVQLFFEDKSHLIYVRSTKDSEYNSQTCGLILDETLELLSQLLFQFKYGKEHYHKVEN